MGTRARWTILSLVVACGAATFAGSALAQHVQGPPPIRAVLNGVLDVGKRDKTAWGRFNFRFHVSRAGVVTGHGDYNGGNGNYISLSSISAFSCSAAQLHATTVATLDNTGESVPATITATAGGPGVGTFTISFGKYSRSGVVQYGKVFLHNCPGA